MIHRTALCTVRAEEIDRMNAMHAEKNAATRGLQHSLGGVVELEQRHATQAHRG